MMRSTLRFFAAIVVIILLVVAHMGVSNLFAYPFNQVNIIFVGLILFLVWTQSGAVVWISFFAHFIIELFSHTPFGIVLFSATMAALCAFWVFQYVVTNKSIIATVVLSGLIVLCYRLIYSILLLLTSVFSSYQAPAVSTILVVMLWEIFFTMSCVFLSYVTLRVVSKRSLVR